MNGWLAFALIVIAFVLGWFQGRVDMRKQFASNATWFKMLVSDMRSNSKTRYEPRIDLMKDQFIEAVRNRTTPPFNKETVVAFHDEIARRHDQ